MLPPAFDNSILPQVTLKVNTYFKNILKKCVNLLAKPYNRLEKNNA
jgi:hypothetical protein